MKINKLEFKNINSYGNKIQELTFDDNGSLILVKGPNGSGKSTIKQSIELCLFGKVQGKNGKKLALNKLPNRRNGCLYTGIYFDNNDGDEVVIKRFIKPNEFEMTVNSEPFNEKYKLMSENDRDNVIGFSFDIFKSFISLNMNDFKNFISLTKDDKETLLNKLFNLSTIDEYYQINHDISKHNNKNIEIYINYISENNDKINEYKLAIKDIKNKQKINKEEKLSQLKEKILNKKPVYEDLSEKFNNCEKEIEIIKSKISKLTNLKNSKQIEKNKFLLKVEVIEEKIKIHDSGHCSYCDSSLSSLDDKSVLNSLKNDLENNNKLIVVCDEYLNKIEEENNKLSLQYDTETENKNIYNKELNSLKNELSVLNEQYKNLKTIGDNFSISKLEENINTLIDKNKEYSQILSDLHNKKEAHDELKELLSTNGIRKNLVKNIISPVNEYLKKYLHTLNSLYNVVLDDNFDAKIYELETLEIDPETMSKGEDKKINIAIALSYLSIVLDKSMSNIMFLDEIFDGLDVDNVDKILNLLKELTRTYKMNILIVNHDSVNRTSFFDKIINVKKDIFSDIEII